MSVAVSGVVSVVESDVKWDAELNVASCPAVVVVAAIVVLVICVVVAVVTSWQLSW